MPLLAASYDRSAGPPSESNLFHRSTQTIPAGDHTQSVALISPLGSANSTTTSQMLDTSHDRTTAPIKSKNQRLPRIGRSLMHRPSNAFDEKHSMYTYMIYIYVVNEKR